MTNRTHYIHLIKAYQDKPFIKVLTGLRRVGKSTLIDLFIDDLKRQGVSPSHILKINFELPSSYSIKNYEDLTKEVLAWSKSKKGPLYVFFDEIGRVASWEKAINGFHSLKQFDVYITGSNADLLSSDLSTFLAGRYIEFVIHPFSYLEFLEAFPKATFKDFMTFGGMPSIEPFQLHYETSMNALRDIYRSALLQDVISRNQVRNPMILELLVRYLLMNPAKTFSALSIAKYLKSQGFRVTVDTILLYLDMIQNAFLIHKAPRTDVIGKRVFQTEEKYFTADLGFREAIVGNNSKIIESILENIVYLELIRRGYQVFVGKVGNKEIDFVAKKTTKTIYIQVTYLMESEDTRTREFESLLTIPDQYPKFIISMDQTDFSDQGVRHLHIEKFLKDLKIL
jgi:predicted AAA+ superfamily ATPase